MELGSSPVTSSERPWRDPGFVFQLICFFGASLSSLARAQSFKHPVFKVPLSSSHQGNPHPPAVSSPSKPLQLRITRLFLFFPQLCQSQGDLPSSQGPSASLRVKSLVWGAASSPQTPRPLASCVWDSAGRGSRRLGSCCLH